MAAAGPCPGARSIAVDLHPLPLGSGDQVQVLFIERFRPPETAVVDELSGAGSRDQSAIANVWRSAHLAQSESFGPGRPLTLSGTTTTPRGRRAGETNSREAENAWLKQAVARGAGATLQPQGSLDPSAEVGRCAGVELERTRPWGPRKFRRSQNARPHDLGVRGPTYPGPVTGHRIAVPLVDGFARPVRDLRISITDRCNLRCGYCMP